MCKIGNHCKPSRAAMDVKNAKKRENRAKKNNIYNTLKEKGMEKEAMAVRAMTPSAAKVYLEKKNIKVEGVEELPIRNDQKAELQSKDSKTAKPAESKKSQAKSEEKAETKQAKAPVKKEAKPVAKKDVAKSQKSKTQKTPAATQKKEQISSTPAEQDTLFDMSQSAPAEKETSKVKKETKPAETEKQSSIVEVKEEKKVASEPKVIKPTPAASAPVVEPKPVPKPVVSDDWDDEDDDDRDYSRYEEGFGSTYDSYGYDDEDEDDDPELKALLDGFDDIEDESADFSDDDFR